MPTPSKREQIVLTALRLFRENGFHATGIDRIVDEAEVSKKTLYHHFRSKDELVLAVLTYYDSTFRNDFIRQVENAARTPKTKLLAVYDVAERWFADRNFFGCLFVNAVREYSEAASPLRTVSQSFKKSMRTYLQELAHEAGLNRADAIAEELALLLEGAIATAHVSGSTASAKTAKRIAAKILAAEQ